MKPIINTVDQIIYNIYKKKHPVLADLIVHWRNIVGPEFSTLCSPTKISTNVKGDKKTNILYITAENSTISVQIAYKQELIIERISVYLGYKAIHKIKLLSKG